MHTIHVALAMILSASFAVWFSPEALLESVPRLLSFDEPPFPADVIVVYAGGGGRRVRHAAALVEAGFSSRILVLGTDAEKRCAQSILADWLRGRDTLLLVPTEDLGTTLAAARFTRDLIRAKSWKSYIIVSDDWHLRRIRSMIGRSFLDSSVQLRYCAANASNGGEWWRDRARVRTIGKEVVKLVAYGALLP